MGQETRDKGQEKEDKKNSRWPKGLAAHRPSAVKWPFIREIQVGKGKVSKGKPRKARLAKASQERQGREPSRKENLEGPFLGALS
jgi:hypothetical protein